MARKVLEIKTTIGDAYIAQDSVQNRYEFTPEDVALGFDALFSKVSVESMLFYAFACCIYAFEVIMDVFRTEIQRVVDASYIANSSWWHAQCMAFQKGFALILDPVTFIYSYSIIDVSAQIIKRCAVRETLQENGSCKVKLLLATETNGIISALSDSDKDLFAIYANQIKPAGVLLQVISGAGDVVDLSLTVNYNPLLMNSSGELIIDSTKPVELAITNFIGNLNTTSFGGKLNVTKLIDAIQSAAAVIDVKITQIKINNAIQTENWGTYDSTNGWFSLGVATIIYQPQTTL
jgi:hypothetical protein